MTLDEYLYDRELTMKEFAALIGYHYNYISGCKNGTRKVSKRLAYVIKKVTEGKVLLNG